MIKLPLRVKENKSTRENIIFSHEVIYDNEINIVLLLNIFSRTKFFTVALLTTTV